MTISFWAEPLNKNKMAMVDVDGFSLRDLLTVG